MPPAAPPPSPFVIGIAGGSGSGKTTIADALVDGLRDLVAVIPHDAYYRHRPDLDQEQRAAVNYDHPDSLETDLLIGHLDRLRSGSQVERPVYDFVRHLRSDRVVPVPAARVIVVEGILIFAEPELRQRLDLKIFVDTEADLRLARRLRRDIDERGRSLESVISQYFDSVRPMHLEFVEPSRRHADLIIPEGYNPAAVGTVVNLLRAHLLRDS